MRILAFSDLHRDLGQAATLVEMSADADVVIGAGDFASVHEGLEETIEALDDVVKQGKALYIGASSMFAYQFSKYLHRADGLVDLIDVHGDRAALVLAEVLRGDPAQGEGRLRLRPVGQVEEHVRHQRGDIGPLAHAERSEVRARNRGDGDGHVLDIFAATLRGHHDLLELRLLGLQWQWRETEGTEEEHRQDGGE